MCDSLLRRPTRFSHDVVMFRCIPTGLTPVLHALPVGVLRGADAATDFPQLAERLRAVDDYHWFDLYVGTHVPRGDIDLSDLHAKLLSYFEAWLR